MKKIMFVDDEPKVLSGLRRMLRGLRHEWDMLFVESGPEALIHLASSPFDVVVTDMRMPIMDGAQLLNHIAEQHPSVVRIILSGQCETSAVLKCVGPAHQFLTKPCDSETLKATVARACCLRDHLPTEQAKQAVSCMQSMQSQPSLYAKLTTELQSTTASIQQICEVVSRDPAMSAKVLQLVSSGFFGTPQRVHDVSYAVGLLGLDTIRALYDHTDSFTPRDQNNPHEDFWSLLTGHCFSVAEAAKKIAELETSDKTLIGNTQIAGMLHDIAIHVLAKDFSELYFEALSEARRDRVSLTKIEEKTFHIRRDLAGAYLMGLWGLPDQIVNAIAYHLFPSDSSDIAFGPLAAVHVANAIMEEEFADVIGAPSPIDIGFIERIGCTDRLDAWREICQSTKLEGAFL